MSLLNRRPFLSPKSVTRLLLKSQRIDEFHWNTGRKLQYPWSAQDRAVIEKMNQYLDRSASLKVGIGELEYYLLGPNESDVDIRYLAVHTRGEQQSTRLARKERATS